MLSSDDSGAAEHRANRERWHKWVPGTCGVLGLLGIAEVARRAKSHAWFRDQHELLSFIVYASCTAALCIGLLALIRLAQPKLNGTLPWRIMSALYFAVIGLKIGFRYIHLCDAGSRLLEGLVLLGTPVLAGGVVFACKGRVRGYVFGTCVLAIIWLLARPYLDWVHGN